jgi:hypothetical protein
MKYITLFVGALFLVSCWKNSVPYTYNRTKVWGHRPIYAAWSDAELIVYQPGKQSIVQPGNIYAFGNFIFQVEEGRGIHVIDNAVPSAAERTGFIMVNGCSQVSIRGKYLYTNSYGDLVTIDISDPAHVRVVNKVLNAIPEMQYEYPLAQPTEPGYFECIRGDSAVVGWIEDSVFTNCFK